MSATYEFWLCDDAGHRIFLLKDLTFASFTRTTLGLGTLNLGYPKKAFQYNPYFLPDWRIEAWRSPEQGFTLRREDVFLIRKPNVYTREDGVDILQFYGRNGYDLLKRRAVIQRAGTSWATKTDFIDDMMKEIVREQMLYGSALDEDGVVDNTRAWPEDEFTVQGEISDGPTVTRDFSGRNVADILKDLKDSSRQLNIENPTTNQKIYFDVIPLDISPQANNSLSPLGWLFQTFTGLRGSDRTAGVEFSLENENIRLPSYFEDHLEEVSSVFVRGNGQGISQKIRAVEDAVRVKSSRWNRIEKVISAASETTDAGLDSAGQSELWADRPEESMTATLLNTPGSRTTPRSLYGIDWDLGDLVRIHYAAKVVDMEVQTVYVSVDENGKEEITGRNGIQ